MHGTLIHTAERDPCCCVRIKAQAQDKSRYSPWFRVNKEEYDAMLMHEGLSGLRNFVAGSLEGRVILGPHQIEGWDEDLKRIWADYTSAHHTSLAVA